MAAEPDRARRRLDEVFGDVLPAVTRDDLPDRADSATGGDPGADPVDEELRANRPPHHDRD